jgi:hypothetical protein
MSNGEDGAEPNLEQSYRYLLTLWTSGVRDYHSMLSDYLTANSIFVAVIGLLVSRESLVLPLTVLIGSSVSLGFCYASKWRSSSVGFQGRMPCGNGNCEELNEIRSGMLKGL